MTSSTLEATRATAVHTLDRLVGDVFDVVDRIADAVERALPAELPKRSDLVGVEPLVRELLAADADVHGAGFVAAPGVLADSEWWLEWFAHAVAAQDRVERLVAETDPSGAHFFDYTLMPWYANPARRGGRVITGPYVDYLCTDDYTMTFTRDVCALGSFVGVAGVDVRVRSVEDLMLPILRQWSGGILAVVNDLGRVVVSNSARLISGTLVHDLQDPEAGVLTTISGTELSLLTRP